MSANLYASDWNAMPDGIWTVKPGMPNSPVGNDGYGWRVYCFSVSPNSRFQQAYRISRDTTGALTCYRYLDENGWDSWYQPYANSKNTFGTASGNIKHGMNGIYVGRFDNAMVGGGKYCIYLIATRSNTTMAYAFPITSYSDHKIYLNRMSAEGVWDFPEWPEIS